MFRRIIPVASLLIQLAYAAIASSTPARAIDEIEMGSVGGPTALLWPLYIGTATGMFAAENLDIKHIFAPSSAGVQQQLAAGAFQISDSGLIDQVRAIFEGAPIALVRIEGQAPPYALLAQRTIKTIAELRGKTIMVGGEKDITRHLTASRPANTICCMRDRRWRDLPRSSRARSRRPFCFRL